MFIKFPSIEQFRAIVKEFDYFNIKDVVTFNATTKLHGTNAAIGFCKTEEGIDVWYQSRNNRILPPPGNDNAGFAQYASNPAIYDFFVNILKPYFADKPVGTKVIIYGEWAGKGIQTKVALNQVERFFSPFEVSVFDNQNNRIDINNNLLDSIPVNDELRIFPVQCFGVKQFKIDFSKPEKVIDELIEECNNVEAECPAGKYFGVVGIGEGIVLSTILLDRVWKFKVKGEKHQSSKVKTLTAVDVEKLESAREFVNYAVSGSRLNQGLEYLREQGLDDSMQNMGTFIRWIIGDILKEETDTIEKNNLDNKTINKLVSQAARNWFVSRC